MSRRVEETLGTWGPQDWREGVLWGRQSPHPLAPTAGLPPDSSPRLSLSTVPPPSPVPGRGDGACALPAPHTAKAFHLSHHVGTLRTSVAPQLLALWHKGGDCRVQVRRHLWALEGQVAGPLREYKGQAGGPGAPPCLAGKGLPPPR